MALDQTDHTLLQKVMEALHTTDTHGMKHLLEILLNAVMKVEREVALKAAPYERSTDRAGYANGFKDKTLNTRMGQLELKIPQVRDSSFYPKSLEKGLRSERALKLAVAEMYLKGVSTRKVEDITEKLCGLEITSTQVSRMTQELDGEFEAFRHRPLGAFPYLVLDAFYIKIRHSGSVIDQAVLIACGVNPLGKREILGVSASLSESEVHWRDFLQSLVKRGLCGVQLITSDDHSGLKAAIRAVLPSVKWQRCQFHMAQNAQSYAPKKALREEIALAMRDIFNSSTLDIALSSSQRIAKAFEKRAPEFVEWLEASIEQGLTCYLFPPSHRCKIRTSNGLERVHREIKRRTRVATLFPNTASALRLVTGVLIEIHEEWVTGKQYLNMDELKHTLTEGAAHRLVG